MQFSSKYLPIATVLIQLDKHDYDGWWNRPLQSPPGVIVVTCATVWSRANSCAVQSTPPGCQIKWNSLS